MSAEAIIFAPIIAVCLFAVGLKIILDCLEPSS